MITLGSRESGIGSGESGAGNSGSGNSGSGNSRKSIRGVFDVMINFIGNREQGAGSSGSGNREEGIVGNQYEQFLML
ncbi:hypothetical protein BJP37_13580 [Moorena bouillonii PNG]|uniref:Uncharacterized protein n=1 Tax=Moorena bouillonii PNG TaxID=568701 RepID=A0A1U7N1Q2_9CYAN|nr:hypothetical protein BJP37_13580 [Moorena bouillonii PNG]